MLKELLIFIYQFYSVCYHGHKKSNNSKPRLSCLTDLPRTLYYSLRCQTRSLDKQGSCSSKKKKKNLHSLADHCGNAPPPGLGNFTLHKPVPQILSSLSSTSPAPGSWPQSHLQGHSTCPLQEPGPELHRQPPLPVPIRAELPTSQMLLGRKKLHFWTPSPAYLVANQGFLEITFLLENHTLATLHVFSLLPLPPTPPLIHQSTLCMELTNTMEKVLVLRSYPNHLKYSWQPTHRIPGLIFLYSSQINI